MRDLALSALAAAGDIAYAWDFESDRVTFAGEAERLFGKDGVPAQGETFLARVNAEDLAGRTAALSHAGIDGRIDAEYRFRRSDGGYCWLHERGLLEFAPDGTRRRLSGVLRVVTDRNAVSDRQRDRAVYDALTGHYNRARVRDAIDHALSQARRYAQQGAFMVVGVDRLDRIASTYGDGVRDQVIVRIGRRLEDAVRATDLIGRIGERGFGVVLGRCDEAGLSAAAQNVIARVAATPVMTKAGPVAASVSVGGVMFPDVAKTPSGAISAAEDAFFDATRAGDGQFAMYRLSERQAILRGDQSMLGAALLDALREDRIAFAYQPVVHGGSGDTAYHETLLRVVGADDGPYEAAIFIPVAEQLGHARHVDRKVLDLAVADLERRPESRLAINVSGHTVTDRSWLRLIDGLLKERPGLARRLIVEITETAEIHDFEDAFHFVTALQDLGCRVALDDFGVGYATFRHLKSLPVDIVKIDGSYIRGISEDRASQAFLETLLGYTDEVGIETVAECVETASDRDYLLERGVTYLQGWIYGRPALDGLTASVA